MRDGQPCRTTKRWTLHCGRADGGARSAMLTDKAALSLSDKPTRIRSLTVDCRHDATLPRRWDGDLHASPNGGMSIGATASKTVASLMCHPFVATDLLTLETTSTQCDANSRLNITHVNCVVLFDSFTNLFPVFFAFSFFHIVRYIFHSPVFFFFSQFFIICIPHVSLYMNSFTKDGRSGHRRRSPCPHKHCFFVVLFAVRVSFFFFWSAPFVEGTDC